MPGPSQLADALRVIRLLRAGPHTVNEIRHELRLPRRKVDRLMAELRELGAPLRETEADRVTETAKRAPTAYALTVDGLREWLG